MEIWKRIMRAIGLIIIFSTFILSCSSPFLKNDNPNTLNIDDGLPEVQVKEIGDDPNMHNMEAGVITKGPSEVSKTNINKEPVPLPQATPISVNQGGKNSNKGKLKKNKKDSVGAGSSSTKKDEKAEAHSFVKKNREPVYESTVGFTGSSRRPDRDPFRIGEKVVMSVRYFKAQAGELTMEVRPPVEVNGRKAYRWNTALKTTGLFTKVYSVEDWAETLVDFETLAPSVFELHVKESGQLRNARGYFDPQTLKGVYVEKKYTEKKGHEEKKQEWQVLPYAQNVFSAAFYMRIFTYEVGKEYRFTVADDEKNMTFKGKALRKERIETDAGDFNTIVVKPEFEIDGVFKPVGDIFFWLTDDDRKLIVHIESEIKIGTLVMDAIEVDSGAN